MPNEREERVCRIRTFLCIHFFHKMHSSKGVHRVIYHISHIDKQIPANIYLFKVAIETLENRVKYVQS